MSFSVHLYVVPFWRFSEDVVLELTDEDIAEALKRFSLKDLLKHVDQLKRLGSLEELKRAVPEQLFLDLFLEKEERKYSEEEGEENKESSSY